MVEEALIQIKTEVATGAEAVQAQNTGRRNVLETILVDDEEENLKLQKAARNELPG